MIEIPELLDAKLPAALFSGGKDSLLLLSMIRESGIPCTIIHFYDRLHPEVEEVIKGWDLELLSWRPTVQYLLPWNSDVALVSEYSFGHGRLSVWRDVIDGEDCGIEKLRTETTPFFDYPFDTTVWGYRSEDQLHPVMPTSFPREFQLGPTRMLAPLYDIKTEDVLEAVQRLPFSPVTDDSIRMCAKCKEGLVGWDRESALMTYAKRFGYLKAA